MNTSLIYTDSVGEAVRRQRVNELECSNLCFVRGTKRWAQGAPGYEKHACMPCLCLKCDPNIAVLLEKSI